jgi:hypothetical protein
VKEQRETCNVRELGNFIKVISPLISPLRMKKILHQLFDQIVILFEYLGQ